MDIPEQFNREAPDFAQLNEGEVWGPFVVVHPRLGELLGAQMTLLDDRVTWFTPDEVGRIIAFSEEPKIMKDGSIVIEEDGTDDVYTIRPLRSQITQTSIWTIQCLWKNFMTWQITSLPPSSWKTTKRNSEIMISNSKVRGFRFMDSPYQMMQGRKR